MSFSLTDPSGGEPVAREQNVLRTVRAELGGDQIVHGAAGRLVLDVRAADSPPAPAPPPHPRLMIALATMCSPAAEPRRRASARRERPALLARPAACDLRLHKSSYKCSYSSTDNKCARPVRQTVTVNTSAVHLYLC